MNVEFFKIDNIRSFGAFHKKFKSSLNIAYNINVFIHSLF